MTENGILYFILPDKMPRHGGVSAKKNMLYDLTCLSTGDSVSVTATVWTKQPCRLMHAGIITAENMRMHNDVETIFVEADKAGYKNRIRFKMAWDEFKCLYASPVPFIVEFSNQISFAFTPKKWNAKRTEMNTIINIIELNRK